VWRKCFHSASGSEVASSSTAMRAMCAPPSRAWGVVGRRGCRGVRLQGWARAPGEDPVDSEVLVRQQKLRMEWMPYLFRRQRERYPWADGWQREVQQRTSRLEDVKFGEGCFVAESAVVLAEPGRTVVLGDGASVAAECFVHGPATLGAGASLNPRCHLDGGTKGIHLGAHTRVGAGSRFFAFDHGMAPNARVRDQPVTSRGIRLGDDVWVGAGASFVDGVTVGDHAVVGMASVVTRDVAPWTIVAGNPARVVGDRRSKCEWTHSPPKEEKKEEEDPAHPGKA